MPTKTNSSFQLGVKHFAVITFAVLVFVLAACSQPPEWQEQYDLGVRYLSEGNYEEAVIAFNAVIEIEPKLAKAYIGLADTYLAMGEQDLAFNAIIDGMNACEDEQQIFDDYISENFDMPMVMISQEITEMLNKGVLTTDDIPSINDYGIEYKGIVIGDTMETVLEKLGFGEGYSFPAVSIYVKGDSLDSYCEYWNKCLYHPGGNTVGEESVAVPDVSIFYEDEEGNQLFSIRYIFADQAYVTEVDYFEKNGIVITETHEDGHVIIEKDYVESAHLIKQEIYRDGELISSYEYN